MDRPYKRAPLDKLLKAEREITLALLAVKREIAARIEEEQAQAKWLPDVSGRIIH